MLRILLALIASVTVWLGLLQLASAVPALSMPASAFAHDGYLDDASQVDTTAAREPPSSYAADTAYPTDGSSSSGAPTRSVVSTRYAYADVDSHVRPAQSDGSGASALEQIEGDCRTLAPIQRGAVAANSGVDLTRVGRWMGDDELLKMQKSGQVQVGGGGTTHVAAPANMATYAKQATPGSKYVEFDAPRTSLHPSGWPGGAQIPSPSHILARLAERRGSPVQFPVPACNIVVVGSC